MLTFNQLKIGHKNPINTSPLSATFEGGALVALLGRNGSGKTTLLRTLHQALAPIEGDICLQGQSLSAISAEALAKQLSIVTTKRLQTPFLKVYDMIAMGRYPYLNFWGQLQAKDKAIVEQSLERLGITALADRYIRACSDGELQLVLIARALAQDTPIILMDEATAHLDFVNRRKIFSLLADLVAEEGKLIFLATHELQLALDFAQQILLFDQGQILVDTPANLLEQQTIQRVFEAEGLSLE